MILFCYILLGPLSRTKGQSYNYNNLLGVLNNALSLKDQEELLAYWLH